MQAATPTPAALDAKHPDADILAAFAEQALSVPERESVLQHLALCLDCRDVIALALPQSAAALPQEESESSVARVAGRAQDKEKRSSWARLNWGSLRWATLAAGVAVAVLVVRPVFEHTGKPRTTANPAANRLSLSPPASTLQIPSDVQPTNSAAMKPTNKDAERNPVARREESPRGKENFGSEGSVNGMPVSSAQRPTPVAPEMHFAGALTPPGDLKQGVRIKKGSISPGVPSGSRYEFRDRNGANNNKLEADKSELSKSAAGSPPPAGEVAAGAAGVPIEEALSPDSTLVARADAVSDQNAPVQSAPRIEKAKPALDEMASRDAAVGGSVNEAQTPSPKPSGSPAAAGSQAEVAQLEVTSRAALAMKPATPSAKLRAQTINWTIADGKLQRSFDGGHSWQVAARADRALLCYANRGREVWAGGQAGTLLHSSDNGATWSAVTVSSNGQSLNSDVIHLELPLPQRIVFSTESHETWSSSDDGKTWEKK